MKAERGQPGWTCPSVCFVRPINSPVFWWPSDRAIKFTPTVFFFFFLWKDEAFSSTVPPGILIFLASPGFFFFFFSNQCSQKHRAHTRPCAFVSGADQTFIVGFVCKCSISYVLCHILSGRLSRCYDCTNQTVELLKAERETSTRWWVREKRLWAHLQRNKTFRSYKQTSTCSISAIVLFVNN